MKNIDLLNHKNAYLKDSIFNISSMNNQTTLLFYLFIGIFSITAIITLLGITGVLKNIKDKYLNALFSALILEVVAAVIFSYKQMDFACDSEMLLDKFIAKTSRVDLQSKSDKVDYLEEIITEYHAIKPEYESLSLKMIDLETKLENCNLELTEVDKTYYMKIIKLRKITRNEMDGTSINLIFNQGNKKDVFLILEQIFTTLGKIDPHMEMSDSYLTNTYIKFLKQYGLQEKLISTNEEGAYTGVYLTDYATSIMIRAYLEKFYPVK